jgi:hypothetical protein
MDNPKDLLWLAGESGPNILGLFLHWSDSPSLTPYCDNILVRVAEATIRVRAEKPGVGLSLTGSAILSHLEEVISPLHVYLDCVTSCFTCLRYFSLSCLLLR